MSNLSSDQFGDQPLPGMERLAGAEPWEQTHEQFLNRPDVYHHGRIVGRNMPLNKMPLGRGEWHAGTSKAALDRIEQIGAPERGNENQHARYYAGLVDPKRMKNTPETPIPDQNLEWDTEHRDHYYRNEAEDVGSISVNLSLNRDTLPNNFANHRDIVSAALRRGERVPAHVRAVHEASGGAEGSRAYFDSRTVRHQDNYDPYDTRPGRPRYAAVERPLPIQVNRIY